MVRSVFLVFCCVSVEGSSGKAARRGSAGGPESEVGQRIWARCASIGAHPRVEIGTPEDSTANNRLSCNHDGEDRLVFQSEGRWGIQ
jgi:hypothetical protein